MAPFFICWATVVEALIKGAKSGMCATSTGVGTATTMKSARRKSEGSLVAVNRAAARRFSLATFVSCGWRAKRGPSKKYKRSPHADKRNAPQFEPVGLCSIQARRRKSALPVIFRGRAICFRPGNAVTEWTMPRRGRIGRNHGCTGETVNINWAKSRAEDMRNVCKVHGHDDTRASGARAAVHTRAAVG